MSTTINIAVGGNGLLDQSRRQMQANRFGKLERDRDAKAEVTATQQKEAQRKQDDVTSGIRQQRRLEQDPAANRRSGIELTLAPASGYNGYALPATTKGIKPLNFTHEFSYPQTEPPESLRQFDFLAGGGPSGTNALTMPEPPANTTYFDSIQARFYITDQNPIAAFASNNGTLYGLASGTWTALTSVKRFGQLNRWTLEGFVRAGSIDPGTGNQALLSQGGLAINGIEMYLYYHQYSVVPGVTARDWKLYLQAPGTDPVTLTYPISTLAFGSWNHLAAIKGENSIKVYLNGISVADLNLTPAYNTQVADELICGEISTSISSGVLTGGGGLTFTVPAIHGYRFTSRARYTANFTPPASIG